jgi:flagellar basal body rod protein FlgC
MATHIKFRLKTFSGRSKEVVKFVKTPQGIVAMTALGVSSANLATNASRHRNDRAYQDKQIEAMDKLTRSIRGLDNTVKKSEVKKDSKPKYITFKPKKP